MIEKALKQYYEVFGQNYPLMITSDKTDEEILEDIERCIASGEPAAEPVYEEDMVY